VTLVIISPCIDIKDGICTTSCPVDCIYEGERMFYIHPVECIECGMCESICPVDAIRYDDDVSEAEKPFIELNADAFRLDGDDIALIGGWKKQMPPLKDPPGVSQTASPRAE
jgi:ferredoxin